MSLKVCEQQGIEGVFKMLVQDHIRAKIAQFLLLNVNLCLFLSENMVMFE